MNASAIICTYNPLMDSFKKCLSAISKAQVKMNLLEVIIIDNNSTPPISKIFVKNALVGNNFKIIVEKEPGLTPARLRGIKESKGEIVIFIDDDNVIEENFFFHGMNIARNYPKIGSWSGQVDLIFERTPDEWTKRYWGLLVYRVFDNDYWSNLPTLPETMPCGAGLFVRREVATHYFNLHLTNKRPIQLDRTGKNLLSGGDNDLAACGCELGYGVGLFHDLKLDHLIPPERLELPYLLKLARGIATSSVIFNSLYNNAPIQPTFKRKVANWIRLIFKSKLQRKFFKVVLEGEEEGRRIIDNRK